MRNAQLLLQLLIAVAEAACPDGTGLRRWLFEAHLKLNDIELADVGGFDIKISGLRCSGFEVGKLSSYTGLTPNTAAGLSSASLTVDSDGLSFNCTIARLDARQISFPHLEPVGSGSVSVSGARLHAGLLAHLTRGVPSSLNVSADTSLAVDAKYVQLTLAGNVWIKLISAIKPLLVGAVVDMLPSIVSGLRRSADDALAPLVANATAFAQRPLPPEQPEPEFTPELTNFSEFALLDFVLNDVVGANGPLGLNRLVDLLTSGTGSLKLNTTALLPQIGIPVAALGNVSLSLLNVRSMSLDDFDDVSLLTNVSEPLTLRLRGAVRGLGVSASASLRVTPSMGTVSSFPLLERFNLSVAVNATAGAAALMLALNRSALLGVDLRELRELPCLLHRALLNASLRSLRLKTSLSRVDVAPVREGELEDELDRALDDAADFGLASFGALLPRAVDVLAAGPLRELLDELLQKLLREASAQCTPLSARPPAPPPALPSAPPMNPDFVDWREAEALRILNQLLLVAPRGLDWLVDALTHHSGQVSLRVPPMQLFLGPLRLSVALPNLTLGGLDSLRELELLKPTPRDAAGLLAGTSLGLLFLSAEVELSARLDDRLDDADGADATPAAAPLRVRIDASFRNLSVGAVARLFVNKTGLASLKLEQALSHNASACFGSQLRYGALSALGTAATFDALRVSGSGATEAMAGAPLGFRLGPASERELLGVINALVASALERLRAPHCPARVSSQPSTLDFRSHSCAARAVARARAAVGALGPLGVDRLVDRLTARPGELRLPRLLELRTTDAMFGAVSLGLEDVALSGADSLFELDVLRPDAAAPTLLHHEIGVGRNASLQLGVTARLQFGSSAPREFRVEVGVRSTLLRLGTNVSVDAGSLAARTVGELLSSRGARALCDIHAFSLTADSSLTPERGGGFTLSLRPVGQQHPALLSASSVSSAVSDAVLRLANRALDAALSAAHRDCAGAPPAAASAAPPPPDGLQEATGAVLASGTALALLLACALGTSGCMRRRRWLEHLRAGLLEADEPARECGAPPAAAVARSDCAAAVGAAWNIERHSLSARFPRPLARLGVPLLVACNVAIFVLGNAFTGATVYLTVTLAGEPVLLPPLRTFSLVNTVSDMWRARAYLLSTLIAFLSGVWPYLKLALLLIAWWLPATYLSPAWRERLVRGVDALGKWSYLDTLMLVVFTVAFHITFDMPSDETGAPLAAALSEVVPGPGVYLFTLGVSLSLVISHTILAMQRVARRDAEEDAAARAYPFLGGPSNGGASNGAASSGGRGDGGQSNSAELAVGIAASRGEPLRDAPAARRRAQALCDHRFTHLFFQKDFELPLRLKLALLLALPASAALLCIACTEDVFSLKLVGLAGELLGPEAATHRWSVVSIAQMLPGASPMAGAAPMRAVQLLFVFFVAGLPLLFLLSLLLLWAVPLTSTAQQRLLFAAEILHAWSAPDVFVLTIIASSLELDRFAHFIVGHECDGVDRLADRYAVEWLTQRAEGCAGIRVDIMPGAAVFVVAVAWWNCVGTLFMHVGRRAK